jgi:hypothetical protein
VKAVEDRTSRRIVQDERAEIQPTHRLRLVCADELYLAPEFGISMSQACVLMFF